MTTLHMKLSTPIATEADSSKNNSLVLQRQVMRANVEVQVGKFCLCCRAATLLRPAIAMPKLYFLKNRPQYPEKKDASLMMILV